MRELEEKAQKHRLKKTNEKTDTLKFTIFTNNASKFKKTNTLKFTSISLLVSVIIIVFKDRNRIDERLSHRLRA